MKRIFKYELSGPEQVIEIHKGYSILSLKTQYGLPCLWALVDDVNEKEKVRFKTIGTGHDATCVEGMKYIDSFLINRDSLVFHVFQETK